MANIVSDRAWRDKYRSATLERLLRNALVTEAICEVDRSDSYRIQNPYGSQPTAEVQALSGQYVVDDFTTTDDALTVTDEVIVAEHIYDFEAVMSNFNLFANRTEEMIYSVGNRIDRFVKKVANLKSLLIDLEAQKWVTRAKEVMASTLNDLTKGLQFLLGMRKSELWL